MIKLRKVIVFLVMGIILTPKFKLVSASEVKENLGEVYEKKVISSISREWLTSENIKYTDKDEALTDEELQMLKESYKSKETYEVLVPKTDSNYEVALSYEDGNYTYLRSADTYDEAVEIAKEEGAELEKNYNSQVIVPTVIDNEGNTVYATLSIARSWKNKRDSAGTSLSYVYSDSSLRNQYTYIHDGYVSEMPIIEEHENEAKVLISGYQGWMNKNENRTAAGYKGPNRDILIQPITYVTNPSYYIVRNGLLIHHISTSMTGNVTYPYTIGVAPSYLREGQRYYSYDGNYFYDGSQGIATGLSNLTRDLQSRTHSRAVNANNPFYNYYSYLPFRSKTRYSADELNRYLNAKTPQGSKLRGLGQAFKNAEDTYGVNALLALGVAMNESARGTSNYAMQRNNLFGLNATDDNTNANTSYYSSPQASVNEFAKTYISRGYADPRDWRYYGGYLGNKKYGANVKYASDPYWAEKAIGYMVEAEYYLSGNNISAMKDYNYYQLLMYTGESNVVDGNYALLYPVHNSINGSSSNVGSVVAYSGGGLREFVGLCYYPIHADRTTDIRTGKFSGFYDWSVKGYVATNKVQLINKGRSWFRAEDLNMDGIVSAMDLAVLGASYNKTKSMAGWNSRYDLNGDGIIDIYDIVRVSCKL